MILLRKLVLDQGPETAHVIIKVFFFFPDLFQVSAKGRYVLNVGVVWKWKTTSQTTIFGMVYYHALRVGH